MIVGVLAGQAARLDAGIRVVAMVGLEMGLDLGEAAVDPSRLVRVPVVSVHVSHLVVPR